MTEVAPRPKSSSVTQSQGFHRMYEEEAAWVLRVLQRLGGFHATEDLVHDVFLAAWRAWSRFDPARPAKPWLFGIAYRVMLDRLRRHPTTREEAHAIVPDRPDAREGPDASTERRQALTVAGRIILTLPIERRAVFIMHELDELPMPDVAEALGVPLNTAYSRLRLARREFADAVAALEAR